MQKKYRVKKEREFQKVFEEGASFANRKFVVYRLEPSGQKHFRVGLSVGKKVGNAVARNQVKRQIRAVLQELKTDRGLFTPTTLQEVALDTAALNDDS